MNPERATGIERTSEKRGADLQEVVVPECWTEVTHWLASEVTGTDSRLSLTDIGVSAPAT